MKSITMVASILILGILGSSCCSKDFVSRRFPILERPLRPQLQNISDADFSVSQETKEKIVGNFNSLIDYSRKLEFTIDQYNEFARRINEETGF